MLVLPLLSFTFLAIAPTGAWAQPIVVLLQGATLIAAFSAAEVHPRLTQLAVLVTAVATLTMTISVLVAGTSRSGLVALFNILLVTMAPIAIGWSIVRRRAIDTRTVLGAICVYVLIGMEWAFIYLAIGSFASEPFFAQLADPTTAEYQYFSFSTLTTVGYGDLSSAANLGRTLAVLEALTGQLYLVTVIALLFSNIRRGLSTPR